MTDAQHEVVVLIRKGMGAVDAIAQAYGLDRTTAFKRMGKILKHREVFFALECTSQADSSHPQKLMHGVWTRDWSKHAGKPNPKGAPAEIFDHIFSGWIPKPEEWPAVLDTCMAAVIKWWKSRPRSLQCTDPRQWKNPQQVITHALGLQVDAAGKTKRFVSNAADYKFCEAMEKAFPDEDDAQTA